MTVRQSVKLRPVHSNYQAKSHNVDSAGGAHCDSADQLWWPQVLSSKRDCVVRVLSLAKGKRGPHHLLYGVNLFIRSQLFLKAPRLPQPALPGAAH